MNINRLLAATLVSTLCLGVSPAFAQSSPRGVDAQVGTEFTYQGQLNDEGAPADGLYDMRFSLFSSAGIQIHAPIMIPAISVEAGLFSAELDFTGTVWTDNSSLEKYLQIEVRLAGGGGFTALTPRTKLTVAPHANVSRLSQGLVFPYFADVTQSFDDVALQITTDIGLAGSFISTSSFTSAFQAHSGTPHFDDFISKVAYISSTETAMGLVGVGSLHGLLGFADNLSSETGVFGLATSLAPNAFGVVAGHLGGKEFNRAFLGGQDMAGLFYGDVHINGNVTQDYNSSPSPIAPVGYGFINSGGSIATATANMSVVWNDVLSRYEISLSDQTISFSSHTTIVTVVDSAEPRVATTNATGGDILVKIWDINSGNIAVQDNFQIVIYGTNPSALLFNDPVPAGVDPELYYQQTGTTPPQTPYAPAIKTPETTSVFRE